MAAAGRRLQAAGRNRCLSADGEERRAHAQAVKQLAEALHRDLGDRALRALVEAQRKAVDGRVAAEPVQIYRDRPDHGVRRDSSCR